MARHGYDAICSHNLFAVYHIDKLSADNRTSFYNVKMCECTQISHEKNVMMLVNIHMKNVNGCDFDTNINRDMCMKVMFIFIGI